MRNEYVIIGEDQFWNCLEILLLQGKNEKYLGKWTDCCLLDSLLRTPLGTTQLLKEDIRNYILIWLLWEKKEKSVSQTKPWRLGFYTRNESLSLENQLNKCLAHTPVWIKDHPSLGRIWLCVHMEAIDKESSQSETDLATLEYGLVK